MSGKIIITLDRSLYRRARVRAWWWKAGIIGLGFALIHWAYDTAPLLRSLGIFPELPHLLAGLLIGAMAAKRPGDIDPRFPPER